jgi:hypothetical protein
MFRLSSLAAVAVAALASMSCGPAVDQAAKADLDRRLSQITISEETYPPSESYSPMSFAAGQWTQHRVQGDKGGVQLLTFKLVGQDAGGYWLETVSESDSGREVAKMHVFLLGGRDSSGMEIRALRVKTGRGTPRDIDPGDPVMGKYRDTLDLLAFAFESDDKDDLHVPAGRFIGCYKTETGRPWGPWQRPSVLCAHPSVPLSGVVRAQPVGGGPILELVAFGTTGADSEL